MALPVLEGNGLFLSCAWSARLQSGQHKVPQVMLGGWSSTFLGYKVFRSAVSWRLPPHWVKGSFSLVLLNTGDEWPFCSPLQHRVGAAHGRQTSEGASSVTHRTGLPPQLLSLWHVLFRGSTDRCLPPGTATPVTQSF